MEALLLLVLIPPIPAVEFRRSFFPSIGTDSIFPESMTAGQFIVAICALGGLIACGAFWWAIRSGQFVHAEEAKYLVFDEGDDPRLQDPGTRP